MVVRWSRVAGPSAVLLALLALGWCWPDSGWVEVLSTSTALAAELEQIETRGYYEEILDAGRRSTSKRSPGQSRDEKSDEALPPPGWVNFADSGIVASDPGFVRWRLKPSLDVVWNGERFRTNRLGFRSPEIDREKPAGTYRIVVLGSSNTMGHGVGDEAVYPRHLERWLAELLAGTGRRIEVVNMAVSGDAPSQRLWRLGQEVGALDPDWVLCDATVLDVSLEEVHLESVVRRGVAIPFAYVRNALERAGVSPGDGAEAFRSKVRGAAVALLEGAYAGWKAEAERLGRPLTVVILPRADKKAENPRLGELIRTLAARYGLDFLDVTHAFDGLEAEQFRVSPWDHHPSNLGHRRLFEAIRDELERRGGGPGLDLPRR